MFKKIRNFIAMLRRIDANLRDVVAWQERLEAALAALSNRTDEKQDIQARVQDIQIRVLDVQDRCYDLLAKSNELLAREV